MNVIVSNKYQTLLSNLNIDVIKNINGVFSANDLVAQFKNFFFNKMILDITALENYEDISNLQKLSLALDMNKVILLLDDSPKVNSAVYLSQLVSMGIYNFTKNIDSITFLLDNPNSYKDVASFHQLNMTPEDIEKSEREMQKNQSFIGQRVVGIKNLTEHAGSTTLSYLLMKHAEKVYQAKAVEIEKNDFEYFSDRNLDTVNVNEFRTYLDQNSNVEVIFVDITNDEVERYCSDVIYLVEPGLVQLNRLIRKDNHIFEKIKDKKLVLNRSVLSKKDVDDFERESGSKVFFNMPNVDDKLDNIKEIKNLLTALGFTRITDENPSGFSLFR